MLNTTKLLNALLAIKAYQLSGIPEKEFELKKLMKSTNRSIEMTDPKPEELHSETYT